MGLPVHIKSQIQAIRRLLDHERPVNDLAPLGSGMRLVRIMPEDFSRVARSPAFERFRTLVEQLLQSCEGSRGLRGYIARAAQTSFCLQARTEEILGYLCDPALYDRCQIQEFERVYWCGLRETIQSNQAGERLAEELLQWARMYQLRYGMRPE